MRMYSNVSMEKRVVGAFLLLILAGALLLWLTGLSGKPLSPVDALFTATSAVCVTGLVVVDTQHDLSPLAQGVVLLLFQLGGLGVITASLALMVGAGRRVDIRSRLLFASTMGKASPSGAVRLLRWVVKGTFLLEALGALCMLPAFLETLPFAQALGAAVFHSVSAFCNAGFSLFSSSLEAYQNTLVIPGVVMTLIVVGGLGFPVWAELWALYAPSLQERPKRFSPAAKLVLVSTLGLVLGGTLGILFFEWHAGLGHLEPFWKCWNALFASVTARTAGFDTVPPRFFSSPGLMVMLLLMVIGASPASTGGGLKTTTLGVVGLAVLGEIRGSRETLLWGRRIPFHTVLRALVLLVLYLGTLFGGTVLLAFFEPFPLRDVVFEVFSALGTVGLSTGITSELTLSGKILIMVLMFWGRVGILTFMSGILHNPEFERISYVPTEIPLG